MSSCWVRVCLRCGGVIDDQGSCDLCSVEGHQQGHFLCGGVEEEGTYSMYMEYDDAVEERGLCKCHR
jgi:hypothetical protein